MLVPQVGRKGRVPTDDAKVKALRGCAHDGQFGYVRLNRTRSVSEVFSMFDFIGLTERMNESFLAMKHLFGLSMTDILYLPSKSSATGSQKDSHGYTIPAKTPWEQESSRVRKVARKEVPKKTRMDLALWHMANRSLQTTIDSISGFRRELGLYQRLLDRAYMMCPRSPCLYRDNGCGYPCLETIY